MLPRARRVYLSADFSIISRTGVKMHTQHLLVHLLGTNSAPTRVGFVTSKAVGKAVARNRVKRRLREISRKTITEYPLGCDLIVRAKANAADASYVELQSEMDSAVRRGIKKLRTA